MKGFVCGVIHKMFSNSSSCVKTGEVFTVLVNVSVFE